MTCTNTSAATSYQLKVMSVYIYIYIYIYILCVCVCWQQVFINLCLVERADKEKCMNFSKVFLFKKQLNVNLKWIIVEIVGKIWDFECFWLCFQPFSRMVQFVLTEFKHCLKLFKEWCKLAFYKFDIKHRLTSQFKQR